MFLYHGSSVIVEIPSLELSRKNLDFGAGFYTTLNKEQAFAFAQKVMNRRNVKTQFVTVYDFDIKTVGRSLKILEFNSPGKLWLDFVLQNRRGIYTGKQYDLVIGPVANDDVYRTLIIYEQGILNVKQTLESLKIKKLYNQYVFKTEKALSYLKYKYSIEPGAA